MCPTLAENSKFFCVLVSIDPCLWVIQKATHAREFNWRTNTIIYLYIRAVHKLRGSVLGLFLLMNATFLMSQAAVKVQKLNGGLNKLDIETQGSTEFLDHSKLTYSNFMATYRYLNPVDLLFMSQ